MNCFKRISFSCVFHCESESFPPTFVQINKQIFCSSMAGILVPVSESARYPVLAKITGTGSAQLLGTIKSDYSKNWRGHHGTCEAEEVVSQTEVDLGDVGRWKWKGVFLPVNYCGQATEGTGCGGGGLHHAFYYLHPLWPLHLDIPSSSFEMIL